jgi:hypothetical protein
VLGFGVPRGGTLGISMVSDHGRGGGGGSGGSTVAAR